MTIGEIVREALHYARTCRSLWLFGFFVGIASGGSNGGGGGGSHGGGAPAGAGVAGVAAGGGSPHVPAAALALLAVGIIVLLVAGFVLRFVGEGALIEGI